MSGCRHDTVAEVILPFTGEHVASVCEVCLVSLPPWFGCTACDTVTVTTFGGDRLRPLLVSPCPTHQEVTW